LPDGASTGPWFSAARGVVTFGDEGGVYDGLLDYPASTRTTQMPQAHRRTGLLPPFAAQRG